MEKDTSGSATSIENGSLVLSLPNSGYAYLVGTVIDIDKVGSPNHEIYSEEDDIHVNFTKAEYSERRITEIETAIGALYRCVMSFDECPLNDVIMASDMLLSLDGISQDELDAVLDSAEGAAAYWAATLEHKGRESLIQQRADGKVSVHDTLRRAREHPPECDSRSEQPGHKKSGPEL